MSGNPYADLLQSEQQTSTAPAAGPNPYASLIQQQDASDADSAALYRFW